MTKNWIIKNRFLVQEELGKGGYGSVCKGLDTITNDYVAIKFVSLVKPRGNPSLFRIKRQRILSLKVQLWNSLISLNSQVLTLTVFPMFSIRSYLLIIGFPKLISYGVTDT